MFFGLGGGVAEDEKKYNEQRREKFLRERDTVNKDEALGKGPTPKHSFREKLATYKENLEVKKEARALKRYKKAKEKEEAKKNKDFRVKRAAERSVYGNELNDTERFEFNAYKREHPSATSGKLKDVGNKAVSFGKKANKVAGEVNNGFGKFGEAADMFTIKANDDLSFGSTADLSPFDVNLADDSTQYGSSRVPPVQREDPLDAFRVQPAAYESAMGMFGTPQLRKEKSELENMFSITYGVKPKKMKKKKGKGNAYDPFAGMGF